MNLPLAGLGDVVSFAAFAMLTIVAPAAGLLISGVAMQKRGLNRWCGIATILFFAALMFEGMIWGLGYKGGISPKVEFWGLMATASVHLLSGLLAILGLSQCIRHHRWPRGRKRAVCVICFNLLLLTVLSIFFYMRVNQDFYNRLFT